MTKDERYWRTIAAAKAMYEFCAKDPDMRPSWLEAMPRDKVKFADMAEIAAAKFLDAE
jgi:hypothetical protein